MSIQQSVADYCCTIVGYDNFTFVVTWSNNMFLHLFGGGVSSPASNLNRPTHQPTGHSRLLLHCLFSQLSIVSGPRDLKDCISQRQQRQVWYIQQYALNNTLPLYFAQPVTGQPINSRWRDPVELGVQGEPLGGSIAEHGRGDGGVLSANAGISHVGFSNESFLPVLG